MHKRIERRSFLKGAAGTAAFATIVSPQTAFGTQANSSLAMGIIGAGGRGSGVATSFVKNTGVRMAAIADLFSDRVAKGEQSFNTANQAKGLGPIDKSHLFVGADAYKRLLDSKNVDVVLISSPPFLHPEHLDATVAAGKHVYCEKPVGVDVYGCKQVMEAGRKAGNKLSLAVGFQIRHATPYVEMVKKIHAGQLGNIVTAQACYLAGRVALPEFPNASPAELRLRHWLNDRVLSGDILVEQSIHVVDICNWVMKGHPTKASGTGGRTGRTDKGDSWSHFVVSYTYPNDVHIAFQSTQLDPGLGDVWERFFGTKGYAEAHYTGGVFIEGPADVKWDSGVARGSKQEISAKDWAVGAFKSSLEDADPNKQKAFAQSITSGQFINEAQTGAESALSAILGRTAAYTGKPVTWDELLASNERWDPKVNLKQLETKS